MTPTIPTITGKATYIYIYSKFPDNVFKIFSNFFKIFGVQRQTSCHINPLSGSNNQQELFKT